MIWFFVTSASWNTSGINNNGGYGDKYYFNSVSLGGQLSGTGGTAGSAAFSNGNGITSASDGDAIDVRNNIFSVTGTSLAAAPLYAHYTTRTNYTGSILNNNNLYVNATAPATSQVGYMSSNRITLLHGKLLPPRKGISVSALPGFVSATDLHIQPGVSNSMEFGGNYRRMELRYRWRGSTCRQVP